jgi:hypothetical protein
MSGSNDGEPTIGQLRDRVRRLRRSNRDLEVELKEIENPGMKRVAKQDAQDDPSRVIEQVRKAKGFHLFHTQDKLSTDDSFTWEGSIEGFLEFAKETGVTTLYLSEWVPEDPDTQNVEVGDVEVGFLLNGRLHVFSTAEYQDVEDGESVVEQDSVVVPYLTAHRAELVSQVAVEILDRPDDSFGTQNLAAQVLRQRLREKVGPVELPLSRIHSLEPDISPMGQLLSEVEREIVQAVQEKERPAVEALYPKWLDFARQIGGHVLSQGDLSVFLDRERAHLTRDGRQTLWTKVKIDLRNERTSEKLSRGRRA